jgi:ribosomal protein S18 acetylase RimI-like enzyme
MDAPIRRLDDVDLPECLDLAVSRGWLRAERQWRVLFEVGEAYGIEDPSGGLAACAILTNLGEELAAVSMVVVAERFGRQGLGQRIMRHTIERAGDRVVLLHASTLGRPMYEKLGFRHVSSAANFFGRLDAVAPVATRQAGDSAGLRRLDAEVTGADRGALLDVLLREAEQVRVVETGGEVTGYATGTRHENLTHIGPVIAADEPGARALIADIAAAVDGPVRVEIDTRNPELLEWAGKGGLQAGVVAPCMVFGDRELPGDAARRYAPVLRALG